MFDSKYFPTSIYRFKFYKHFTNSYTNNIFYQQIPLNSFVFALNVFGYLFLFTLKIETTLYIFGGYKSPVKPPDTVRASERSRDTGRIVESSTICHDLSTF